MPGILLPSWFHRPSLKKLLSVLPEVSEKVRFVGGCVRDSLLNKPVEDVDLATRYRPEEIMRFLERADIKILTHGLDHGTVGAVLEGDLYEITTLRRDVETFGRHATIAFTEDWREDASRRDFTINALFLSVSGEIFDYFGGEKDLKAGRVRFIGAAEERIREDYLRILRFFRFQGRYGEGIPDDEALAAIRKHAPSLKTLSAERVQAELFKIFSGPNGVRLAEIMNEVGCYKILFNFEQIDLKALGEVLRIESLLDLSPQPLLRMAALFEPTSGYACVLGETLRLSNKDRETVNFLEKDAGDMPLHEVLYRYGPALTRLKMMLEACKGRLSQGEAKAREETIRDWKKPVFPLKGTDLKALGVPEGPSLGLLLKTLEQDWIDSRFEGGKEKYLKKALTLFQKEG